MWGGEDLNHYHSGTFLFGCIPIGQTSTWQSWTIAQCQKHLPGMWDLWTWTPPAASLCGLACCVHYKHSLWESRAQVAGRWHISHTGNRGTEVRCTAFFIPPPRSRPFYRFMLYTDELSRDGKWAFGNRPEGFLPLRRKQECELTSSFSGFVLGSLWQREGGKLHNPCFQRTLRTDIYGHKSPHLDAV
jgi:hypothetical protein